MSLSVALITNLSMMLFSYSCFCLLQSAETSPASSLQSLPISPCSEKSLPFKVNKKWTILFCFTESVCLCLRQKKRAVHWMLSKWLCPAFEHYCHCHLSKFLSNLSSSRVLVPWMILQLCWISARLFVSWQVVWWASQHPFNCLTDQWSSSRTIGWKSSRSEILNGRPAAWAVTQLLSKDLP